MLRKLQDELGISVAQFLDRYDVDLRYIAGPAYVGPPLAENTDMWGVKRRVVHVGAHGAAEDYSEASDSPLASANSVEEVERYGHWPSPDWFDYRAIEAQCDAIRRDARAVVFMGDRLNRVAQLKPAMYLRGVESILTDLALNPEVAAAILMRIRRFYLAYLERILDAARGKIDVVLTGDDFGSQNGPLVSLEMWRRFLKPGFAEYIGLIKQYDAVAMHHTCGSVAQLIPDMIECRLDVLQSLQPEARDMSLADLKQRFGTRLAFHGGVSIQQTMPFGSPAEVRRAVQRIVAAVGTRGGYIFCTAHNIQADTPVANVVALLEEYLHAGRTSSAQHS